MTDATEPRQRRLSFERISAVFAVVVSLTTLAVLAVQTSLMQKQARASVWPHVGIGFSSNPTGFAWVVSNNGVGPALIQQVVVTVDGAAQSDWNAVLKALAITEHGGLFTNQLSDTVLTPAERAVDVYEVMKLQPGNAAAVMLAAVDRVAIELCYCSIYEDCWVTKFRETRKTPVDRCPTAAKQFTN